jgi:hypothetical protein
MRKLFGGIALLVLVSCAVLGARQLGISRLTNGYMVYATEFAREIEDRHCPGLPATGAQLAAMIMNSWIEDRAMFENLPACDSVEEEVSRAQFRTTAATNTPACRYPTVDDKGKNGDRFDIGFNANMRARVAYEDNQDVAMRQSCDDIVLRLRSGGMHVPAEQAVAPGVRK